MGSQLERDRALVHEALKQARAATMDDSLPDGGSPAWCHNVITAINVSHPLPPDPAPSEDVRAWADRFLRELSMFDGGAMPTTQHARGKALDVLLARIGPPPPTASADVERERALVRAARGVKTRWTSRPGRTDMYIGTEPLTDAECDEVLAAVSLAHPRSAPTSAERATAWQPIDTVPDDGTAVLLWGPGWRSPLVSEVRRKAWAHPAATSQPTHWAPAPLPPGSPAAPSASAYRAGVEAAAKACDELADQPGWDAAWGRALGHAATRIRALTPPQPVQGASGDALEWAERIANLRRLRDAYDNSEAHASIGDKAHFMDCLSALLDAETKGTTK